MADWRDWELDEIPEWSKPAQHLLLFFGLGIALLGATKFVFQPLQNDIATAKMENAALSNQQKVKTLQLTKVSEQENRYQKLKSDYQQYLNFFPESKQLTEFISIINKIGAQKQLTFERVERQAIRQSMHFNILPLRLELKGNYQNLNSFLEALLQLPYLVTFEQIDVQKIIQDNGQSQLQFSILVFAYHHATSPNNNSAETTSAWSYRAALNHDTLSIKRDPFLMALPLKAQQKSSCPNLHQIPKLEFFSDQLLSELLFKGIIHDGDKYSALIMNDDSQIHSVVKGQVIGANHGVIENINPQSVSISEYILNEIGCWQKVSRLLTRVTYED